MFKLSPKMSQKTAALPSRFLNSYEIINLGGLEWRVREYKFERIDGRTLTHEDRGEIKNILWELRAKYPERVAGTGFVVDITPDTVIVPDKWLFPVPLEYKDFRIKPGRENILINASEPVYQKSAAGIIREGLKIFIKRQHSPVFGKFWQDFDSFCQAPKSSDKHEDVEICRKFDIVCKQLRGSRLVVEIIIGTTILDSRTFADYYRKAQISDLGDMIKAKQANKINRQGKPVEVRAVREKDGNLEAVEIDDLATVFRTGKLPREKQIAGADNGITCHSFGHDPEKVSLDELKLILDSQITQEDHAETILSPIEREPVMREMRNFINGAEIFKKAIFLSETPFDLNTVPQISFLPPRLRLRGAEAGEELIMESPSRHSAEELKKRYLKRAQIIRQNGFLQQRSINPLLAWPKKFVLDKVPAERLLEDLNRIWQEQNIKFKFDLFIYEDVESLRKEVERGGYNALFAVLPESWKSPYHESDTHEQIKRKIPVPSQCIHFDKTLSTKWINKPIKELETKDAVTARRIRQRYELCLGGLLVKHHWIPFAPAEEFNYNVHFGLDVGGTHNTDVVSCIGYGFKSPLKRLIFRPDKIPVKVGKAEPIPSNSLYVGLIEQIEKVYSFLKENGQEPDFEKVLFFRDGQLLGDGDRWNERDALIQLHDEMFKRGWITTNAVWTVAEVMKYAEGWRMFRNVEGAANALVGDCSFPFEDENQAILCTTGEPFRLQGTAAPLLIRISHLCGQASVEEPLRDLVWSADLGFTKPDMGLRLPWVLNVADTGALQQSKSYEITGITAS